MTNTKTLTINKNGIILNKYRIIMSMKIGNYITL